MKMSEYINKLIGRSIYTNFCKECKAFYIILMDKKKIEICPICKTKFKNTIITIEKVEE